MGTSITKDTPAAETAQFALSPTSKGFLEDGSELVPGSEHVGMVANGGLGLSRRRLSSEEVPRQLSIVELVPRAPNGKGDYPGAKKRFA